MSNKESDFSTDSAWEEWGRRDPYFGVITHPKFRLADMNEQSRREFFDSGVAHVDYLMRTIRQYVDPAFVPKRVWTSDVVLDGRSFHSPRLPSRLLESTFP